MNATPFRSPRDDAREHTSGSGTAPRTQSITDVDEADMHPAVRRILARHGAVPADRERSDGRVLPDTTTNPDADGEQLDLADRQALRRVAGLSTELEDVTEVEYRQLRLERVVLVGVLDRRHRRRRGELPAELAALAETAGCAVLDGVLQRRDKPDPATYIGCGKARGPARASWRRPAPTRSSATAS